MDKVNASRRKFQLAALMVVAILGFGASLISYLGTDSEAASKRFDAHSFAVFQETYESLQTQSIDTRIEHVRKLVEAAESSELTAGMGETIAEFCQKVLASEEASEVKTEARLVLNAVEKRHLLSSASGVARGVASKE